MSKSEARPSSAAQRNYYHAVVVNLISQKTKLTPTQVHEILKWEGLSYKAEVPGRDGQIKKVVTTRSTKDLTTSEMEDYLAFCREYGSIEFGVFIPAPNEVLDESCG